MKTLFYITHNISIFLINATNKYSYQIIKVEKISFVLFIIFTILYRALNTTNAYLPYFSFIFLYLFIFCEYTKDCNRTLVSIRGFLGVGILYWLLSIISLSALIFSLSNINNIILQIIIIYVLEIVIWIFYSLLANNKVAYTANQLLSFLFSIIVLLKDNILLIIPDDISYETELGYNFKQIIEIIFNFIFTPILLINLLALAFCVLKGYWIEKYNDNKDI